MNEVERGGGVGGNVGNSQSFPQGFSQAGQNGDQFGQNVPQGMSFSQGSVPSGRGDIILDSGASSGGKSRKWIVVILIVAVVLAALIGGGVALWRSGGDDGLVVEADFNVFRNLVLYGENDGSYPTGDGLYAIQDVIFNTNGEEVNRYLELVWQNGHALLKSKDYSSDESIQIIALWAKTASFCYFEDNGVVEDLEKRGYDFALKQINKNYEDLINSQSSEVAEISQAMNNVEKSYLDYLSDLKGLGCNLSNYLNETNGCAEIISENNLSFDGNYGVAWSEYNKVWRILGGAVAGIRGSNA